MKKLNKRIDRAATKVKDVATRVADNVLDGTAALVEKAEGVVASAGHAADSAATGLETARVEMARTRRSLRRMKR